jgi:hypothetical protein
MSDLTITRSAELMVAHIQAHTDAATAFVDGYIPDRSGAGFHVVDSGRIMVEERDMDAFVAEARRRGFEVEIEEGRP